MTREMNATGDGANSHRIQRILVVGGGFGGLYTAYHLDKIFRHHAGVEVTLVSRDNYFLMTPFLFEAGSGVLEPKRSMELPANARHAA